MPLPALAVAAIVVIGQSTGVIGNVGNAIVSVDKAIPAIIDLSKILPPLFSRPAQPRRGAAVKTTKRVIAK